MNIAIDQSFDLRIKLLMELGQSSSVNCTYRISRDGWLSPTVFISRSDTEQILAIGFQIVNIHTGYYCDAHLFKNNNNKKIIINVVSVAVLIIVINRHNEESYSWLS